MIDEKQIRDLLAKVPYPGFTRDIISFGIVKAITVGSEIKVQLVVSTNDTGVGAKLRSSVEEALADLPGKPPVLSLIHI